MNLMRSDRMSLQEFQAFENMPKTANEAKQLCIYANRILANEGVLDAYGHVSIRNPENPDIFFQARAVAPEFVTMEDLLEIDLEGNVLTDSPYRPYGERVIHAAVFKNRPDVHAVFHGHPQEVIVMSALGIPIRSMAQYCGVFYEPLPFYDDYEKEGGLLIVSMEEAIKLAGVMGGAAGVVMRGHGVTLVGNSIQQAVMNAIFLRDCAKLQLMALPVGEPKYLSKEEGECAVRTQYSTLSLERCWNCWLERAKKAMPDLA